MKRRDFIKVSGAAAAGFAMAGCMPGIGSWSKQEEKLYGPKKTGHFSLMQISSATDTIGKVIHSRLPDAFLDNEPESGDNARGYYRVLDNTRERTDIINLHRPMQRFDIDGVGILVMAVDHPEFKSGHFNNQSVIIRVWDDAKSVVFLGDAEEECGDAALRECREYLDCDYLQMAHHGQGGCSEEFYKTVNFRACLWPTPSWVWEPGDRTWLTTYDTRRWMDEKGITEHHVSCLETDWTLL